MDHLQFRTADLLGQAPRSRGEPVRPLGIARTCERHEPCRENLVSCHGCQLFVAMARQHCSRDCAPDMEVARNLPHRTNGKLGGMTWSAGGRKAARTPPLERLVGDFRDRPQHHRLRCVSVGRLAYPLQPQLGGDATRSHLPELMQRSQIVRTRLVGPGLRPVRPRHLANVKIAP